MDAHNRCHYIVNLYTKKRIYCDKNVVTNEILYIKKNINKLDRDIIYLFKFDNSMYYVVNSNELTIQPATDLRTFKYIWALYNDRSNIPHLINNITKNVKNTMHKLDMYNSDMYGNIVFNEVKFTQFLHNINTEENNNEAKTAVKAYIINEIIDKEKKKGHDMCKDAQIYMMFNRKGSDEILQHGGGLLDFLGPAKHIVYTILFPIKGFEVFAHKHFPTGLSTAISIILGILDFIFLLLTLIPFKDEIMGAGLVISAVAFIYAWLRADFVGAIAYALSAIPLLGGFLGGFIKSSGESIKLLEFIFQPAEGAIKLSESAIESLGLEEKLGQTGVKLLRSGIKSTAELTEQKAQELIKQKIQELQQKAPAEAAAVVAELSQDPDLTKKLVQQMITDLKQ